ncbi:hypothetical protein OAI75_01790 [Woeseiaceae bacterium]|nr:hypothetical protein [Woeseiaceae bacterium]
MASNLQSSTNLEKAQLAASAIQIRQNQLIRQGIDNLAVLQTGSLIIETQILDINAAQLKLQAASFKLQKNFYQDTLKEQKRQTELAETQAHLLELQTDEARLEREEKKAGKERTKILNELLFQSKREADRIKGNRQHKVQNFFELNHLLASLTNAGVSTEMVDNFGEKAFVAGAFDQIAEAIELLTQSFDSDEAEDVAAIIEILAVDEKQLVKEKTKELKKIERRLIGLADKHSDIGVKIKHKEKSKSLAENSLLSAKVKLNEMKTIGSILKSVFKA